MLRELLWPHRLPNAVRRWLRSQRVERSTEAMARIRTIKPEFWTDAKTGTLPEFSKCLFLGLLNHSLHPPIVGG